MGKKGIQRKNGLLSTSAPELMRDQAEYLLLRGLQKITKKSSQPVDLNWQSMHSHFHFFLLKSTRVCKSKEDCSAEMIFNLF